MAIRFNSELLVQDIAAARKRRHLSEYRAAERMGLNQTTLMRLRNGTIVEITVSTLAKIMHFLGQTDIEKYIYEDGEN